MSMLAEKKRREKWCLNPRGKAWSDDQTKIGQRMLEKMGWNTGQGLGVNNQGPTDILKIRKKDDKKGLGFKVNGEEWLKTTSDFYELLDNLGLNVKRDYSEQIDTDSTSSLVDRSKSSKVRVHYQKFTKAKDLSHYSEKDLASIIGPSVIKSKSGNESDVNYTGSQINKGSSEEYFNAKKKSKTCNSSTHNSCEELSGHDWEKEKEVSSNNKKHKRNNQAEVEEEESSSKKKKKHKNIDDNDISESQNGENVAKDNIKTSEDNLEVSFKKKKKKRMCDIYEKQIEEYTDKGNVDTEVDLDIHNLPKKKKSKKNIQNHESCENNTEGISDENKHLNVETEDKKISKKKNRKSDKTEQLYEEIHSEIVEITSKKKKNKKSIQDNAIHIHESSDKNEELDEETNSEAVEISSKKKKNRKSIQDNENHINERFDKNEQLDGEANSEVLEISSKKKKNRKSIQENDTIESNDKTEQLDQGTISEGVGNSFKKKKNQKNIQGYEDQIEENSEKTEQLKVGTDLVAVEISPKKNKNRNNKYENQINESTNYVKALDTNSEKVSKKRKRPCENEFEIIENANDEFEGFYNKAVDSEKMSKKKKKKIEDENATCFEKDPYEGDNFLHSEDKNKRKTKKGNENIDSLLPVESTVTVKQSEKETLKSLKENKSKKEKIQKENINTDSLFAEAAEEQSLESNQSKKKSKKEKKLTETVNGEIENTETAVKQANLPTDSKECLEVLGRKTRLRKINKFPCSTKPMKYETGEFMSFSSKDSRSKFDALPKDVQNDNYQKDNPLFKVFVVPNKHDCSKPKHVVMHEYRLLTDKLKQLNLVAPQLKVIIKDSATLSQGTRKKLKILYKSKQIKALLPLDSSIEVETAVKKFSEELKPKIDMINALVEIEEKTALLAEEFTEDCPNPSRGDSATKDEEKSESRAPNPDKIEVLKNMSKQLQFLLEKNNCIPSETVDSSSSSNVESVNPKRKSTRESAKQRGEVADSDKDNVQRPSSLQSRIEARLQVLAEQMKMIVEGRKPAGITTSRGRGRVNTRGSFNKHVEQHDIEDRAGENVFNQHMTSFRGRGQQRGRGVLTRFGRGQRGMRGSVPFGGWGFLQNYGIEQSERWGGHQGMGGFTYFAERGETNEFRGRRNFRGRGRDDLKQRGRISQNNFDAKQYAEKCKALNKVPELTFNGVDLKVIPGYATNNNTEASNVSNTSSSKIVSDSPKTSVVFSEIVVEKEKK